MATVGLSKTVHYALTAAMHRSKVYNSLTRRLQIELCYM